MKTFVLPLALVTLAISAIASAQTTPPPSGSATEPPSSTQAPAATGSSSYSSTDMKAQLKECVAKQKAANAKISDADAKAACAKTEPK